MEFLTVLWLPIILCAITLFFASFVFWTLMPHRKSEWKKLPGENEFLQATGSLEIPAGRYSFPHCTDPAVRNSDAFKATWKKGPRGTIIVWGRDTMGTNMACTIVFFLVTSVLIAYLAWFGMMDKPDDATTFANVFRITAGTSFLAYATAGIPASIWFKRSVPNDILDGVVYALITGIIFSLLWPYPSG